MTENKIGKVVQVIGPVVDIKFDETSLPNIYNEIKIDMGDRELVVEVEQHVGDDIVRAIAMESTDGLRRGMKAVDTGKPISVPVGKNVLGRLFYYVEGVTLEEMLRAARTAARIASSGRAASRWKVVEVSNGV